MSDLTPSNTTADAQPLLPLEAVLAQLDATLAAVEKQCAAGNTAASQARVVARNRSTVYAAMNALGGWIVAFLVAQPSEQEISEAKVRVVGPLRSWSQTGRLLDRALAKLRGYPGDFEVVEIIHAIEPGGASARARILDDYFLNMLTSAAIRNRSARLAARLGEALTAERGRGRAPMYVLSLGNGPVPELALLLDDPVFLKMTEVTCVDRDRDGLRYARKRLTKHLDGRVRYVRTDPLRVADLPNRTPAGYHIIYAASLLDFLPTDGVMQLLAGCHSLLAPGGLLLVCNLSSRMPASEHALLDWLMETRANYRSESQLRSIFAATPFGAGGLHFDYEPLGIICLVAARRAS